MIITERPFSTSDPSLTYFGDVRMRELFGEVGTSGIDFQRILAQPMTQKGLQRA